MSGKEGKKKGKEEKGEKGGRGGGREKENREWKNDKRQRRGSDIKPHFETLRDKLYKNHKHFVKVSGQMHNVKSY